MRTTHVVVTFLTIAAAAAEPASAQTTNQCQAEVHDIAGYPEYASGLDGAQKGVLKYVAKKIVNSQGTASPFVSFDIIGHSDAALRKPVDERAAFELEVSERRAVAARDALLTEIMALPGGYELAGRLAFLTRGEGSRYRLFRPSKDHAWLTQDEMLANRRVEIYITHCTLTPRAQRAASDTLQTRIDRLLALVASKGIPGASPAREKRAPCVLNVLKRPTVLDWYVDGSAKSPPGVGKYAAILGEDGMPVPLVSWTGIYDTAAAPLPPTELAKFFGRMLVILDAEGFAPSQTDAHVLALLDVLLKQAEDGVNLLTEYVGRQGSSVNNTRRRLSRFVSDHASDPDSIYSCGI